MAREGRYLMVNNMAEEVHEQEIVHFVVLEVLYTVVVVVEGVVVVVVLKINLRNLGLVRSTAANNEVIGGSLTCSGGFASGSSGRLPIDCIELLLEVIP